MWTEPRNKDCAWLREFSSCCCLSALTGPVILLLSKIYNPFFSPQSRCTYCEPNRRPAKGSLKAKIKPKSRVIYFPLVLRHQPVEDSCDRGDGVLKIAWPHRWEHDKNPESFFECLLRLKSDGFRFKVAVLGESYNEKPPIFDEFRCIANYNLHLPDFPRRNLS